MDWYGPISSTGVNNDGISPLCPSILCDVFQNGVERCGILNKEEIY